MSTDDEGPPPSPPRRPSQPHHTRSTSSNDFATLDQVPSRTQSAAGPTPRARGDPSSSTWPPVTQPRPPPRRNRDSAASAAPSTAPSNAPSRSSTAPQQQQQQQRKKQQRPRPPNLAGPGPFSRMRVVPESFLERRESDRTPGSVHSSIAGAGGGYEGGSFVAQSVSGDTAAEKSDGGGARKPLWAIGGVFPKHAAKRRRSSVVRELREKGVRRGSTAPAPPLASHSTTDISLDRSRAIGGGVGGSGKRSKLPYVPERGDSISATISDSTGSAPDDTASETGSTRGAPVGHTGTGVGVGNERSDPFEDLAREQSRRSRRGSAPLESADEREEDAEEPRRRQSGRERRASVPLESADEREEEDVDVDPHRQLKDEVRAEVGAEVEARLNKVHSGGSRTVAGEEDEDGEKNEKDGEGPPPGETEDGEPEMREPGHGGPQVGGELDQSAKQWAEDVDEPDDLSVRNWWGTVRYALREPLAEFLGTLVLICIGIGADCQTKISQETMGAYQSMNWSWGFGVMTALYIAGGISGGHTNPAVTITLAIFRGFPWKMVPRYIIAQVLGGFCGALIIYGNYRRAINEYDPYKLIAATDYSNASATLFITAPTVGVSSTVEGFCQEILAGAILTIAVLALGDENNAPPGAGLGAIVLGFVVVAIGMSNGWISGYAVNPARDFGPRLALWALGYGTNLWTHDDWWWLVGPICGPVIGSIAGALAYDLCIFTGPGSPINFSGTELADAVGLNSVHNMVWIALSPQKRRERRLADHPRSEDDLAEAGLAATLARQRTVRSHPGRSTEEDKDELALNRRWRRGKEKVIRQEQRSRQRERETRSEYRRSIDEARERERQRWMAEVVPHGTQEVQGA
ncbi:hypothetical protein JCM10449v2_001972 [Rhodotorula kratochvilovae]